jgi:hypothetical protein
MSEEKSTEEQNEKIEAIVGDEALGYDGGAREEHSGAKSSSDKRRDSTGLADNRPEQIK